MSLFGPPNIGLSRQGRHCPQQKASPLGMPVEGWLVRVRGWGWGWGRVGVRVRGRMRVRVRVRVGIALGRAYGPRPLGRLRARRARRRLGLTASPAHRVLLIKVPPEGVAE